MLTKAAQVIDPARRAALYGKAVTLIQRDNPVVYTYRLRNLVVRSAGLVGVEVYSDGVLRLGKAAFAADREG